MDGFEYIKQGLENALGVTFTVKFAAEDITAEQKKAFTKMIKTLEKLSISEEKIFMDTGIDTSTIVEPYWKALEQVVYVSFGKEAGELIWWYIYDRKNAAGKVIAWEDEEGAEVIFKNPGELYDYILVRYGIV